MKSFTKDHENIMQTTSVVPDN